MNKPVVVLADLDANYLIPLEDKLTEELYDQIDLEIITNKVYFEEYFFSPKKIDTLIVSSELFSYDLLRHNVSDFFVLTEDSADVGSSDNITRIFKYSSTKEIFNQIVYKNKEILNVQFSNKETQVITVISGIGGSGKTTVSMALCDSIARNHKRVLFISTDIMQGFSCYLQNQSELSNDIARAFRSADDNLYKNILPFLRHEKFTYLPPFARSIQSLGLKSEIYNRIVLAAKATKEYDYIVIDTDLNLDEAKADLIQKSDKTIIVVLQDSVATKKTDFLVKNIDCRNAEKFIFVCNKFRRDADNEYINSTVGQQFMIAEYIEELQGYKAYSLESYTELVGIKNLAYLFS